MYSQTVHVSWPLFDLRLVTPKLTLRVPYDKELLRLAETAAGNVLRPDEAHFMGPWTQIPSPEFERSFMRYHWLTRAEWKLERWNLNFCVYPQGEETAVGMAGVHTANYPQLRSATTGSWLLPEWRGQGLGKEARAAALHLLFVGLGAKEARSGAHTENARSHGVSSSLGYVKDGTAPILSGAGPREEIRLLLRRETWEEYIRDDIEIQGLDGCLEMFGLEEGNE